MSVDRKKIFFVFNLLKIKIKNFFISIILYKKLSFEFKNFISVSKITENLHSSPKALISTARSPSVRRGFKCPFKSPIPSEAKNENKTPILNKRKCEDSPSSSLFSTPKTKKLANSRHLSFHSPFRSPIFKNSPHDPQKLRETLNILLKKESELDENITELESQGLQAEKVQNHIDQLHKYNDIKDMAQIVMGRLAEINGLSLKEIHSKYGAPSED